MVVTQYTLNVIDRDAGNLEDTRTLCQFPSTLGALTLVAPVLEGENWRLFRSFRDALWYTLEGLELSEIHSDGLAELDVDQLSIDLWFTYLDQVGTTRFRPLITPYTETARTAAQKEFA